MEMNLKKLFSFLWVVTISAQAAGIALGVRVDMDLPPLHAAAKQGNFEALSAFLDAGADPNIAYKGHTPLELAAESIEASALNHISCCQYLWITAARRGEIKGKQSCRAILQEKYKQFICFGPPGGEAIHLPVFMDSFIVLYNMVMID